MGKVIIAAGPTASGKTKWLQKWQQEDPEKRVSLHGDAVSVGNIWKVLAEGKDVGVEISTLLIPNPVPGFGIHNVEVKTFA